MKLSIELIAESLSEYGARIVCSDERKFEFRGVQILSAPPDELEDGILYVCETKVPPQLGKTLVSNHGFVFKTSSQQMRNKHFACGIVLDTQASIADVTNHLIRLFDRLNNFESRVKDASLKHNGVEPFFEIAAVDFPRCLLIVADSAYNILCASKSNVDDI